MSGQAGARRVAGAGAGPCLGRETLRVPTIGFYVAQTSTCPGAGSWPGAPYGGDLPLVAVVSSWHRASLPRDVAPGTEGTLGAELCRMGPCEPSLCPLPVQPGSATTRHIGDGYKMGTRWVRVSGCS